LAAGGGDFPTSGVADGAGDAAGVDPANELAFHALGRRVPLRARGGIEGDNVDMDQLVEMLADALR
jgi:hypothetical protein